jgi:hypothetical protein
MRTAAALLTAVCLVPATAGAQVPAYAHPDPDAAQTISGSIDRLSGTYGMTLRDDRGYLDDVRLHHGTVIQPTGTTLRPGMHVTLHGRADGKVFDVDEVDVAESDVSQPGYASPYVPYGGGYDFGYVYGSFGYPGYYGNGYWPIGVQPWPYYAYPTQIYVVPVPVVQSPAPYVPPPVHQRRHTLQSGAQPPAMRYQAPPARTAAPTHRASLGAPRTSGGVRH